MSIKRKWKCPRCGARNPLEEDRCKGCRLIKSRLKKATNSAGKKALKNKEYNKVVYLEGIPSDIKKWQLVLYTVFLGFFGVQYYKVGRKKMFWYMMISFFLIAFLSLLVVTNIFPMTLFEHKYWRFFAWGCILPESMALIIWIGSIVQVAFNKFKIPVAIDEEYFIENGDDEVAKEILEEVKENRKKENIEIEEKKNSGTKKKKIRVICASCGQFVKVDEDETICPKCEESLKG